MNPLEEISVQMTSQESSHTSTSSSLIFIPPSHDTTATETDTASPASTQSSTSTSLGNLSTPSEFEFLNEWNWQQQQQQHQVSASERQDSPTIPTLTVIRQPEEQHRARYLSEGSRGAIKDRSGTSNCTIQISGFYRPTRVEMFASTGTGAVMPHQLYRLIPVSGKSANTTPCRKMSAHDGIECLEITLRPESSMTAVLDCVGILKICSYDAKQRKRFHGAAGGQHSAVRIAFRAYIPHEGQANTFTVIEAQTETIRCVQQLGIPEVLKMSATTSLARGGGDLFIIGRNFDRNTSVVFREYKDDGSLAWNAEASVDKQYLHQCHIVCTIPTYHNLYRGGNVSVTVRCGQKSSHPINFAYTPSVPEEFTDWRPPSSPQYNNRSDIFDEYDYSMPSTANQGSIFGPTVITSPRLEYTGAHQKYSDCGNHSGFSEFDTMKKSAYHDNSKNMEAKRPKLQLYRYSTATPHSSS